MKHTMKKALSLLLSLLLALPTFALAEDTATEYGDALLPAPEEIVTEAVDPESEEEGELSLDDFDGELSPQEIVPEDAAQIVEDAASQDWYFIVQDALYAMVTVAAGDAVTPPEDPAAPEGYAFAGWFLEDGTQLFIDADGDGEIDPVIASPDPLRPEVNVDARFDEAQATEEEPVIEEPVEEPVVEEPVEEPVVEEPVEEPVVEEPVEEPVVEDPSRSRWWKSPSRSRWLRSPSRSRRWKNPSRSRWLKSPSRSPSRSPWRRSPSRSPWRRSPPRSPWRRSPSRSPSRSPWWRNPPRSP